MRGKLPHIVQYQGSKRKLASQILQYMPKEFGRLVEPFAGTAAISIAAAESRMTNSFYINDVNQPLVSVLEMAINKPKTLVERYRELWNRQFKYKTNHVQHFYDVREQFNNGDKSPEKMLYLLARCVKGSIRYSKEGKFNQSPDKRRHGTNPDTLEKNVHVISSLMKGKVEFASKDYKKIFTDVKTGDLVYMDPPYQGVSNKKDNRYYSGIIFEEFVDALETLNKKGVDYLISYDGQCGEREYGESLPEKLGCKKVLLNAGLSSQDLLLGKKSTTLEALYISSKLVPFFYKKPYQLYF